MSKMSVPLSTLENPEVELLPVEELLTVDGIEKMVKCQYIGVISASKQIQAKSDNADQLKLTIQVNRPIDIVYIDDILTYKKPMVRRLSELTAMLDLQEKARAGNLEDDDYLGKYVVFTVTHNTFTTKQGEEVKKNQIDRYIRPATEEEIKKASDTPF